MIVERLKVQFCHCEYEADRENWFSEVLKSTNIQYINNGTSPIIPLTAANMDLCLCCQAFVSFQQRHRS